MKPQGLVFIGLIALAYYLVYIGLVGIHVPAYYIPVPYDGNGHPVVTGAYAFGLIAFGAIIFAVSYMELENHYNFSIKIMNKHHCEKLMIFYVGTIIIIVYSIYLLVSNKWYFPIEWFYLALMTYIGCLGGIIYYKITNHKAVNLRTIILFWKDK